MVNRMVTIMHAVPGTLGERLAMRNKLEAMVDTIEWETQTRGENEGRGRLPALFVTFTAAIYSPATCVMAVGSASVHIRSR